MKEFFTGAGVAVLMVAATGANALTSSQTLNFADTSGTSLTVTGFDTSLGSLTGVSAEMSGTAMIEGGSIEGTTDEETFSFLVYINGTVSIFGGGLDLSRNLPTLSVYCTSATACSDEYPDYSWGFSRSGSSSQLSSFLDTDVVLNLDVETVSSDVSGSSLSSRPTDWRATGSLTVTYTYDELPGAPAVPLPAALPLLLAGLGAFGIASRRRRS